MSTVEVIKSIPTFEGVLVQYTHESNTVNTPMRFSIFIPKSATVDNKANVLFWLSGLTCTDENFCLKAQPAFEAASSCNMVIVISDTSPRGANCPGDKDAWDFGEGAGFYLNAQTDDFKKYYNMYDYITIELNNIVQSIIGSGSEKNNIITTKRGISGHSMGGLGALNLYLKSGLYSSCSAFAPISNPINCPWGQKAFNGYLGPIEEKKNEWEAYDPSVLVSKSVENKTIDPNNTIRIEQGLDDKFYIEKQLLPEVFVEAAKKAGVDVEYHTHEGLDHSYTFVSQFIADHVKWHAEKLSKE